jgi:LPXTG-motif cell wall-anchored protein
MSDVVISELSKEEIYAKYYLLLVSSPLNDVPNADKAALEAKAKDLGATPGTWYDISMYKVKGDEKSHLSKVGTPVNLKVTVPQSLRKDGRTFYALRYHDGKVTVAAQGTGDTLEWKTDEFSTNLIAYEDAASKTSQLPKTGDPISTGAIAVLFVASVITLGAGVVLRRRSTRKF